MHSWVLVFLHQNTYLFLTNNTGTHSQFYNLRGIFFYDLFHLFDTWARSIFSVLQIQFVPVKYLSPFIVTHINIQYLFWWKICGGSQEKKMCPFEVPKDVNNFCLELVKTAKTEKIAFILLLYKNTSNRGHKSDDIDTLF